MITRPETWNNNVFSALNKTYFFFDLLANRINNYNRTNNILVVYNTAFAFNWSVNPVLITTELN